VPSFFVSLSRIQILLVLLCCDYTEVATADTTLLCC